MNEPSRERFLRDEFHGLTLGATTQRGNVYARGLSEAERSLVHQSLRTSLDGMSAEYLREVSESVHLARIAELADKISSRHAALLAGGRFRIGSAQKALNLFLKYLWCAGLIPTPPHCPFDARVIAKLPSADRCAWTTLDEMPSYQHLVEAARRVAGDRSLAEWELDLYNTVSVAAVRARKSAAPPAGQAESVERSQS